MSLRSMNVAYWALGEASGTRVDGTGRGNDFAGTYAPLATLVSGPCSEQAIDFPDGQTNYLLAQNSADLALGDEPFEWTGWVRAHNVAQTGYILAKALDFPANIDYALIYTAADGKLTWQVRNAANTAYGSVQENIAAVTWYFVDFYHDPTVNEIGISINNGAFVTTNWTAGVNTTNGPLYLGHATTGGTQFAGSVCALGLWKGRLLTSQERTDLYNAGCPADYPFAGGHPCDAYYLGFGSYVFESTFYPADDGLVWATASAKLPRAHGSRDLDQTLDRKRLLVRGGFIRGPFDRTNEIRPRLDDLKAALAAAPQNLYFYDDRYWRDTRVDVFRNPYGPTGFCRIAAEIEIEFASSDPFQYSAALSNNTWGAPVNAETRIVTAGGNAFAQPVFRFTVGGSAGETIDWTLTNNTTGESFTLAGDVMAGDVIEVDTLLKTVLIGTVDYSSLFDGLFPTLAVGENTLEITIDASAITQIVVEWRNRWW